MAQALKALLLSTLFLPCLVTADEISEVTIKDTSGFTRAVSEIDGVGNVEFNLVDEGGTPAEGVEVTLTSAETGEVISAVAVNGAVIFDTVPPGIWTVASAVPEVTFTNVAIGSSAALVPAAGAGAAGLSSLGVSSSAVAAGGVAAVGAGTAAVASSRSSDSKKPTTSPLSPSS